MLHKHLLSGCATIALLTASAWAGAIHDPAASVEADNFSLPISSFNHTFSPTDNGGVLGLYNDTGAIITALFLHTVINTGLTTADITSSFNCNSGTANPFFLNCGFDYVSSTGSLTISFYGVNPPDGDEFTGIDTEIGQQEGIPPLPARCLLNPDNLDCNAVGHFAFVFNNNFLPSGSEGNGWTTDTTSTANPGTPLFNGAPMFDPPQFSTSPEPGTLLLLCGGVFALAGLSRRRR